MSSVTPIACSGLALLFFCQQRKLVSQYEEQISKLVLENQTLGDQIHHDADSISHLEGQVHQLELDLTMSQEKHQTCLQENQNHRKRIEQLEADLTFARNSQSMESTRLQQTISSLQSEVDSTKVEFTNSKNSIEQFEAKVAELMLALENVQHARSEAEDKTHKQAEEIQSVYRQFDRLTQQLVVAEGELEQAAEDVTRLRNSLDTYQQKYESCMNEISSLKTELNSQNERMNWSIEQESEKNESISRLKLDIETTWRKNCVLEEQLSLAKASISKLEAELEDSRTDHQKAVEEISKNESVILELYERLALFQHEGLKLEEVARKLQTDFNEYKKKHCHTNNEFIETNKIMNQMRFSMEQLRGDLQIKIRQTGDQTNKIKELKQELESVQNQKETFEKEIDLLREYLFQSQR